MYIKINMHNENLLYSNLFHCAHIHTYVLQWINRALLARGFHTINKKWNRMRAGNVRHRSRLSISITRNLAKGESPLCIYQPHVYSQANKHICTWYISVKMKLWTRHAGSEHEGHRAWNRKCPLVLLQTGDGVARAASHSSVTLAQRSAGWPETDLNSRFLLNSNCPSRLFSFLFLF